MVVLELAPSWDTGVGESDGDSDDEDMMIMCVPPPLELLGVLQTRRRPRGILIYGDGGVGAILFCRRRRAGSLSLLYLELCNRRMLRHLPWL